MIDNKEIEWNKSYENGDNFLFSPNEEVVRFVSRYLRKQTGLNSYQDKVDDLDSAKILDLGCGIGRHVVFGHSLGLEMYGIDLSKTAVDIAKLWAHSAGIPKYRERILQGDVSKLPWDAGFFSYVISHGVLDSMPFEIARKSVLEVARALEIGGLFYCDLISGDDSKHNSNYCGEEIVTTKHEEFTVQSFFNLDKIETLFEGFFRIVESNLARNLNTLNGEFTSRYHLVLQRV
jgi:SAM-dependent methyltransferase